MYGMFKKAGIEVMTDASVESVDTKGTGCKVNIKTKTGKSPADFKKLAETKASSRKGN